MTQESQQSPAAPTAFAIPQVSISSAPALEVRELNGGKPGRISDLLAEFATLGDGWVLETANQFRALYNPHRRNQHGAYSDDDSLHADYCYLSADESPLFPGARVVVGFDLGYVGYLYGYSLARARAVRVAGQFSDV